MDKIQRVIDRLAGLFPSWIREPFRDLLSLLFRDLPRVVILGGLGVLLLAPDSATWSLVRYSFGLAFFLILASHVTRRLLFSKLDLQELLRQGAEERNLPAAISGLAICAVLIAVMFIMSMPFFR